MPDSHEDDPLWAEFYKTQGPGGSVPPSIQPPTVPTPRWEDRLDTYLHAVWAVCMSVLGYIGLVVLAVMLATHIVGMFDG